MENTWLPVRLHIGIFDSLAMYRTTGCRSSTLNSLQLKPNRQVFGLKILTDNKKTRIAYLASLNKQYGWVAKSILNDTLICWSVAFSMLPLFNLKSFGLELGSTSASSKMVLLMWSLRFLSIWLWFSLRRLRRSIMVLLSISLLSNDMVRMIGYIKVLAPWYLPVQDIDTIHFVSSLILSSTLKATVRHVARKVDKHASSVTILIFAVQRRKRFRIVICTVYITFCQWQFGIHGLRGMGRHGTTLNKVGNLHVPSWKKNFGVTNSTVYYSHCLPSFIDIIAYKKSGVT
jgi:hypothetical protein